MCLARGFASEPLPSADSASDPVRMGGGMTG